MPTRRWTMIAGAAAVALAATGISTAAAVPGTQIGHDSAHDPISVEEQTTELGLWDPLLGFFAHTAAAADVNDDGWVDLYVGGFYQELPWDTFFRFGTRGATEISPDRMLLGGPDGFTVDPTFPQMRDGNSSGSSFADFDHDGDLDLLVSHYYPYEYASQNPTNGQQVVVLRNDDGRFTRLHQVAGQIGARALAVADFDGDGLHDFFVVEDVYYEDKLGPASSRFYRGTASFEFTDATATAGLPDDLSGLGATAADLNGDGWPDLLISGSLRGKEVPAGAGTYQRARIFVNDTRGGFIEADGSEFTMVSELWRDESAGVAVGDLNRDGRQDLVIGAHPYPGLATVWPQAIDIYLNDGNDDAGLPVFRDVTEETGIGLVDAKSAHITLADMDNDGWLDIASGVSVGDGTSPAIFRHLGLVDGVPRFDTPPGLLDERTATPETSQWENAGLKRYWPTGVNADFDRDGRVDMFAAEWFPELPSRYWKNTSDAGRWISVDVGPAGSALGSTVNVYRPGDRVRGKPPIVSRQVLSGESYGAGALHTQHVGIGELRVVEVEVVGPAPDRERETRYVVAGSSVRLDL